MVYMVCEVLVSHSQTAILFRLHPLFGKTESEQNGRLATQDKLFASLSPPPQSVDDHPVMSDKGRKVEHTTKNAVKLQLN